MVEIIVEPQAPIANTYGVMQGFLNFLHDNLVWMIVIVLLIIAFIVIYYLFANNEEKNKERDDPGYALYRNHQRTAKLRADDKRIRKTYSLKNLLWMGIPILWNEHSAKVINIENEIIGYYRGHFESMDNCLNLLVYRRKFFIFFEELFLVKMPLLLKINTAERDEKTKKMVTKERLISLDSLIEFWKNGSVKIHCTDIEKIGLYYYCPVFIIDKEKGKLDYRKVIEGAVVDQTYQTMIQRVTTEAQKTMERMPSFNPFIQYAQKSPEKTKVEEREDRGTEE